jgi:hypothetical protein
MDFATVIDSFKIPWLVDPPGQLRIHKWRRYITEVLTAKRLLPSSQDS